MQGAVVPTGTLQSSLQATHSSTQHTVTQHPQQTAVQQQNLLRDQSANLNQVLLTAPSSNPQLGTHRGWQES